MLPLSSQQIDLWIAIPDEIQDVHQLARYRQLLSTSEQLQEQRFYFKKDQHRFLITRALVRSVLSRYAHVSPERWQFSDNPYGKPQIANDESTAKSIAFNISHTDGLIVLAVTEHQLLGVDVENSRLRKAPLAIADHYFSPQEIDELHRLPEEQQQDYFFQFWTLKEAYIKARGMGLSIPLNQFSFNLLDPAGGRLDVHERLKDSADRWYFWQWRMNSDYLLALCSEKSQYGTPQLNIRKIVPLGDDQEVGMEFVRQF